MLLFVLNQVHGAKSNVVNYSEIKDLLFSSLLRFRGVSTLSPSTRKRETHVVSIGVKSTTSILLLNEFLCVPMPDRKLDTVHKWMKAIPFLLKIFLDTANIESQRWISLRRKHCRLDRLRSRTWPRTGYSNSWNVVNIV